jgi:hypothetical protein
MPMEPPRPLEKEVDRSEFAEHLVKVQVEALLHHLRGHQNGPGGTGRAGRVFGREKAPLVEEAQHLILDALAAANPEAGVEEQEEGVPTLVTLDLSLQGEVDLLGRGDRVSHHAQASALLRTLGNEVRDADRVSEKAWVKTELDVQAAGCALDGLLTHGFIPMDDGDQRVG